MANSVWRSFIAMFGICAIAWAFDAIPVYRKDAPLADAAKRILSGDKFSAAQLNAMKRQLDAASARPLQASALNSAVVIRLLLLEDELKAGNRQPSALVELQMLVSAALVLIITVGGAKVLEGSGPVVIQVLFIVLYLVLAFYAGRWNRGVLPVAAALGVLLATFALVAAPSWFNRDKTGFTQPAINAGLLGLLTLLLLPVQILLIAFAMRGIWINPAGACEGVDKNASKPQWKTASST